MPWRRLASVASGEFMSSSMARTAEALLVPVHTPAEKVVMIWMAGGNGPSTVMPSRLMSSLNCWKPSSTAPRATRLPTGTPGGGLHDAALDLPGNAPTLEQAGQRNATGPGRIADAARGEHSLAHRLFGRDVGLVRTCAHRHRHARAHQVHFGAGLHAAGSDQLVDRIGRQDDHVKSLAGLYAPGRIDPAHRFDGHAAARTALKRIHQLSQHLASGHGGDAFDFGRHGRQDRTLLIMPQLSA